MRVKARKERKFGLFNPVKIKLLVKLSDIDPDYLGSEEDKDIGSIMELDYTPSGVYLDQSGRTFLSDIDEIELIEGTHFEFL